MKIIIPEIEEIVNFYTPEVVEQIARETSFVQRESKFGGMEFMGIMTEGLFAQPDATLNQMAAMAKEINPTLEISGPGIHQRIDETGVEFLKILLKEALSISTKKVIDESIPDLLKPFGRVYLLDSTYISLPESLSALWEGSGGDASEAGMKLQLMIDYKSGNYVNIVPTNGITPDQSYIMEAVKLVTQGELIIDDLGYFNTDALFDLSEKGGYFLSRLNHQVCLYKEDESKALIKFDLVKELKKAQKRGIGSCEFEVWLIKENTRMKVRVIAERMPDNVAKERRRKARQNAKKKGYTPTDKHLFLLSWGLYITNVPVDIWETKSVSIVYRLRWQIELVFKSWKSYHGLTFLKGERKERIECFIYGRLIMMVIIAFLSSSIRRYLWNTKKRELSFLKTVRHFQLKAYKALSLLSQPVSFALFLMEEFFSACRLCMMDSRKRLSTAQMIRRGSGASS